jgi:hypothetical protein
MKLIFLKRAAATLAAFGTAAAIAACGSSDTTGTTGTAAAVAAATSPPASTTAGVAIAGPSVKVTDAGGAPAAGVTVNFAVTAGGGSVQYPIVTSGADGIASSGTWQIGGAGTNTLTATVASLPAVSFTTTAQFGNGSAIVKRGGDNQIGFRTQPLPNPLTVKVVSAGGLGIPGQTVTFTVASGGGSIAGSPAVTDANGFASSGAWTMGSTFGNFNVVAQTGTLQTTFTAIVDPCENRIALAVGQTVTGSLAYDPSLCAMAGAADDRYLLTTPAGAVNITLASTAFDALLNVWNTAGKIQVATNDNSGPGTTNSALRLITASGTKTVDATTVTAGATGAYTLSVASTSEDVADCSNVYIEIGATTNQNLTTTDCKTNFAPVATAAQTGEGIWKNANVAGDAYLVYIAAGTTVRISQTAQPLDAAIAFYSPSGALILFRDNGGVGATPEVIDYTATVSGYYKIVAGSYCLLYNDVYQAGCDYGPYTLSVIIP